MQTLEEIVFVKLNEEGTQGDELEMINTYLQSLLTLDYSGQLPAMNIQDQPRNIYNYIALSLETLANKLHESTVSAKVVNTILQDFPNQVYVVTDSNWCIRFINHTGITLFGRPFDEMLGEDLSDYIPALNYFSTSKRTTFELEAEVLTNGAAQRHKLSVRKKASDADVFGEEDEIIEYILSFTTEKKVTTSDSDLPTQPSHLFISSENTKSKVFLKDIIYFQAEGSYTKIYLNDKTRMITSKNLKEYEKLENYGFFRIHKSFIINLNHVHTIDHTKNTVTLQDKSVVPISRRKKAEFNSLITNGK